MEVALPLQRHHPPLNMRALPPFPQEVAVGALAAGDARAIAR